MKIFYKLEGGHVNIIIPEGKTMLSDGQEIVAPNWSCSIPVSDTMALSEYLTTEQIAELS